MRAREHFFSCRNACRHGNARLWLLRSRWVDSRVFPVGIHASQIFGVQRPVEDAGPRLRGVLLPRDALHLLDDSRMPACQVVPPSRVRAHEPRVPLIHATCPEIALTA